MRFVLITTVAGLLLVGAGIGLPFLIDKLVQDGIKEDIVPVPPEVSETIYNNWVNNDNPERNPPEYMTYRIFNVTNVDEVIAGGKPVLEEKGPYVYRTKWERFNVTWHDNNSYVTYKRFRQFFFQPHLSNGSEDDLLTTPNMGFMGVAAVLEPFCSGGLVCQSPAQLLERANVQLFETRPVKEILWGFDLAFLGDLPPGLPVPTRVELFWNCTSQDDCDERHGFWGMNTGKDDIDKVHTFSMWEDYDDVPCWNGPYAVGGTDKKQFPPGVKKSDILTVWEDDAWRRIDMEFDYEVTIYGIKLYRFHPVNETWETPNDELYMYGPTGQFNMTSANVIKYGSGSPVFISRPHYLGAAQELQDGVIGLKPDRAIHETQLSVEPTMGKTMQGSRRAQLNVQMLSRFWNHRGSKYANVRENMFVPFVWFDENASLTKDLADEFKGSIYLAQDISYYSQVLCLSAGSVVLLFGGFLYTRYRKSGGSDAPASQHNERINDTSETSPLIA